MRVMFLGPPSRTLDYLNGNEIVEATEEPITAGQMYKFDILVSHGYRHILKTDVLNAVPAVNLHIALLPWNRGADPNLWSWADGTPKGVTIHWIDAGIDTGPIIAQREVSLPHDGTLASTYELLQSAMTALFIQWWPQIKSGKAPRRAQKGNGSFHRVSDRALIDHLLTFGWDTPVSCLSRASAYRREHGYLR